MVQNAVRLIAGVATGGARLSTSKNPADSMSEIVRVKTRVQPRAERAIDTTQNEMSSCSTKGPAAPFRSTNTPTA